MLSFIYQHRPFCYLSQIATILYTKLPSYIHPTPQRYYLGQGITRADAKSHAHELVTQANKHDTDPLTGAAWTTGTCKRQATNARTRGKTKNK